MLAKPFRFVSRLVKRNRSKKDRNKKLSRLEQIIGYCFKNIKLLETALSHLSYINERGLEYRDSNERLEFLGDAVLDLIVSEHLFERFSNAREGELTRIKSSIVSRNALASKAAKLKLEDFVIFSKESFPDLKRGKKTVISNSLEAVIGAVYLDGGLQAAENFICEHILEGGKTELSFDDLQEAKNSLLHLSQVNYHCQPSYRIVEVTGPEHAKQFACEVMISGKIMGKGTGANKKESEKKAAAQALEQLARINLNSG